MTHLEELCLELPAQESQFDGVDFRFGLVEEILDNGRLVSWEVQELGGRHGAQTVLPGPAIRGCMATPTEYMPSQHKSSLTVRSEHDDAVILHHHDDTEDHGLVRFGVELNGSLSRAKTEAIQTPTLTILTCTGLPRSSSTK